MMIRHLVDCNRPICSLLFAAWNEPWPPPDSSRSSLLSHHQQTNRLFSANSIACVNSEIHTVWERANETTTNKLSAKKDEVARLPHNNAAWCVVISRCVSLSRTKSAVSRAASQLLVTSHRSWVYLSFHMSLTLSSSRSDVCSPLCSLIINVQCFFFLVPSSHSRPGGCWETEDDDFFSSLFFMIGCSSQSKQNSLGGEHFVDMIIKS